MICSFQVHHDYESEMATREERLKYLIVRNKYFKPTDKQNFLTWDEKEQIRDSHKTDPEQWTIEKLAESFPATEEIILKVIRSKWTPKNVKRIQEHDASVRETWKLFEAGKLGQLHPDFVEHLKKFSHRRFDSANNAYTKAVNDQAQFQFPKPKTKEFSHIIASLPRPKTKPVEIEADASAKKTILINNQKNDESILPPTTDDTYVYGQIFDKKYKTFDQFERSKKPLESASGRSQELRNRRPQAISDEGDQKTTVEINNGIAKVSTDNTLPSNQETQSPSLSQIERYTTVSNPSGTGVVVDLNEANKFDANKYVQKYNTRTVTIKEFDKEQIQIQEIKDRIYIPRKAYKRGAVYKLNDCFYDDDGEFLYRVPGLDGRV